MEELEAVVTRPIFVGQAPSRLSDPGEPLSGRSGRFMARLLGVGERRWLAFRRENLNASWPGRAGEKGDLFSFPEGFERAEEICGAAARVRLVLLGAKVARCFGLPGSFLEVHRWPGGEALVLPHPSGVNRWWNSAANRRRARRVARRFALTPGRH